MSDYVTHEIETENGAFYVRVLAAERRTFSRHVMGRSEPGEELRPRVWLATDPEFKQEFELGYVKVRGRKYVIEEMLALVNGPSGRQWQREPTYGGSFRSERKQVEYRAPTFNVLREYVHGALAKFAEAHPKWERESVHRLFRCERNRKLSEAVRLRAEAEAAEKKAAGWQERIDELGKEA
ncbi:hypothetical protein [Streptomyces sp. NPDC048057]|uniref:hypothetical protein n=1 Tax=Streptomyces sp. NPDC048057 TaxID=3155628 RepID=UPI0033EDC0CF